MKLLKIVSALCLTGVLCGCTAIADKSDLSFSGDLTEKTTFSPADITKDEENSTSVGEVTDEESNHPAYIDWPLFIVSEEFPLPNNFSIATKNVYKKVELDVRCADFAVDMINAALDDGVELNVTSGYRSVEKQKENIEFYIDNYMKEGYSYEEAESLTYKEVAKPGCSEHNAGVAMDIVTEDWFMSHSELTQDFEYTTEFQWLQDNSWKYGFIMSFPSGKEDITGFAYEPWHYRFVGLEAAQEINNLGNITLNEYLELL